MLGSIDTVVFGSEDYLLLLLLRER